MALDTVPDLLAGLSEGRLSRRALAARAAALREVGFTWGAVNMTQLYTAGARDVASQREALERIRERVVSETGL